ncbi:hypothetical protein, partial [Pseudomonas syringae group genomosp. 7]|uniref:hypothetical protein n=1 Tax=Pseudomonas syringae group genomosp. 7 TaxID=251699 RepID=UPI00376F8022
LQIFFDTDLTEENEVKILDLKGGILQVETSLDWENFSRLEFSEQQIKFVNKMYCVVKKVVEAHSLNKAKYENAFEELLKDINR